MHVNSIATGQQGGKGGWKSGTATVSVVDNFGNPVTDATVSGTFSGDFSESSGPVATDASGVAAFETVDTKKGSVTISFCVSLLSHSSLTYTPSDNPDPSYACAGSDVAGQNTSKADLPNGFSLAQNYPNPFNPSTMISFSIPEATHLTLKVFDALGREVAILADGFYEPGRHVVHFDADGLVAGTYLYVVSGAGWSASRPMLLLK
jgi:hypothetical protein